MALIGGFRRGGFSGGSLLLAVGLGALRPFPTPSLLSLLPVHYSRYIPPAAMLHVIVSSSCKTISPNKLSSISWLAYDTLSE